MNEMLHDVRQFHDHMGFATSNPLRSPSLEVDELVNDIKELSKQAFQLWDSTQDETMYRAHLILEELGEFLEAFNYAGIYGMTGVADGLVDLLYVVVGTMVQIDLPYQQIWDEIHKSNMSKQPRTPEDPRCRNKGPDYRPPDIATLIQQHTCEHRWINTDSPSVVVCALCGKKGRLFL